MRGFFTCPLEGGTQGQLNTVHGSQTYPLAYTYDSQGRMTAMTTWKDFAGDTGKATTTWQFDPQRGQLASKTYSPESVPSVPSSPPSGLPSPVSYKYTPGGRLHARTWSRTFISPVSGLPSPVSTTYDYTPDGALSTVDYSDSTPDIAYTYHRLGQVSEVRDGILVAGAIADADLRYRHTYAFDPATLRPDTETILTFGQYQLQRHYEAAAPGEVPGRYRGYTLSSASVSSVSSVVYKYDSSGRLQKVTSGPSTFTYAYLPNAALIESVTGPVHTVSNTYQPFGYGVLSKTNRVGDTVISKFGYTLNDLGQRTAMINTGTAFAQPSQYQYRYNEKGEVIAGNRYEGTDPLNPGPAIPSDTFAYRFDDIGNRLTATRGAPAAPLQKEAYTANLLNQYTSIVSQISNPQITVSPVHDADGNLVSDTRWHYIWNAENRLISMETVGACLQANPAFPAQRILFAYDYQGRRTSKQVYRWDTVSSLWAPVSDLRYLYDGWNLVAEFTPNTDPATVDSQPFTVHRSYTWGQDLRSESVV